MAGALLVKLFGQPDIEARRFAGRAERVRDIGIQSAMYSRTFFVAMLLVASLAQALTYGLGGWLAVTGGVSAGTVVTLALLLTRLYGPLTALSNVRVDVMSALVSFDRVFEVLDLAPGIVEKPDAVPVPPRNGRVDFRDVRFRYPSAAEISLASLEEVATLDRTINEPVLKGSRSASSRGRWSPWSARPVRASRRCPCWSPASTTSPTGRCWSVGSTCATPPSRPCATRSAWSPRIRTCSTRRSPRTFGTLPDATDDEIWAALAGAQVADLVRSLPDGLDTTVGERGYRFSGGEKQRIAIARLLLKAPSIVILDEATAHLDSESEAAVQRALSVALAGRTALVIAHRLSTVRDADQILVLDGGRIVERGRHDELVAVGGLYAELYRTQFAVADSPAPFVDATGPEPVGIPLGSYVADEALPPARRTDPRSRSGRPDGRGGSRGQAGRRSGRPVATRSSANAAPRVTAVKCAFRPLGLGSTHSRAPASGSGCGPKVALGRPNPIRYAVTPTTATQRGRCRATVLVRSRAPSRSSPAVSSSARALARAAMLVMPRPRAGNSSCSLGCSSRGVKPPRCSAGQNRLPGRAKCQPVAADQSPGLMPTKSTASPSPSTSGMVRSVAAASSARVGRGWPAVTARAARRRRPAR
ncbi:hypothetical protein GCM10027614_23690 [Micromonospora vulcania]